MRTSQCPYFLGSCPLVAIPNADPPPPPPPPSNPRPAPLHQPNSYASGSPQLPSPSLSSYQGFGSPSPSLQGASLGQPSLYERRKQYKAEMFKNQVERQGGGGGGGGQQRSIPPRTSTSTTASSSSSSSFPTSSYCLPASLSTNTSREASSEGSPILSYNPQQPSYQSSVNASSSSSSSNYFPLPFDDSLLTSPSPYLFPNQNQTQYDSSQGFTDLLQLHTSPPVLFQQPQPTVDDDEYLSSSTASFPYSPDFYGGGGGDWQGTSYGSLEFDGLVQPENASFGMEETPATRQEFVRVVESRPPREKPASSSSQVSQGNEEMLGEQTAFISKLWHVITHVEYQQFLRWSKDGRAFVLLDQENFAAIVLPRFFRHSKLTSFVRQLNLYSFQRVSVEYLVYEAPTTSPYQSHQPIPPVNGSPSAGKTVVASGFSHPSFQRDHPELLCQLHPRVPGKPKPSSRRDDKAGSKKSSATRGVGRS